MLLLMVYWDDEDDKKNRLEKRLRQKKAEREGLSPAIIHTEDSQPSSEELSKALAIIERQGAERAEKDKQILALMESLQKTQSLLEDSIKNNQPGNYQIVHRPAEKTEHQGKIDSDMPVLEDIDAKIAVIDTSGIEVGKGKVGESTESGEGTKNKANKLKELLKKKRGKN